MNNFEIKNLYLKITQSHLDSLINKCKDEKIFDIGIVSLSELKDDINILIRELNNNDLLSRAFAQSKINSKEIYKTIYSQLEEIPNLRELYKLHLKRAEHKYKSINPMKLYMLNEDERNICDKACSFTYDKPHAIYDNCQDIIDDIKSNNVFSEFNKSKQKLIFKIRPDKAGVNNAYIKNFVKKLMENNHIDNDGESELIALLSGEKPKSLINWKGTKGSKNAKAELCRIFYTIADNKLLFNPSVPWENIQSKFIINEEIVTNLKVAAGNKKIDDYSEEIVKSAFKLKI